MKKSLAKFIVFASLCLGLASPALADGTRMLKSTTPASQNIGGIKCGATDSNSYGTFTVDEQVSAPYNTETSDIVVVKVYSDVTGAVATVDIEQAPTATGPWSASTTITNPAESTVPYTLGRYNWVRIHVTAYTSGNIFGCISAWRGTAQTY